MEPKEMQSIYELEASLRVVTVESTPVDAQKKIEEAFIPKSEQAAGLAGENWKAIELHKEEKN